MAGTKISALSSLSTLADTTVVPVVASGVNYKMAGSVIKTSISQLTKCSNTAVLGSDGELTLTGAIKASGLNPTITNGSYSASLDGSGLFSSSAFLASEGSSAAGNHGYSFTGDGGYDTGMFSSGDGFLQFYSNNIKVIEINSTGQVVSILKNVLIGSAASSTNWPNAQVIATQSLTSHSHTYNFGLVGEAVASSTDSTKWGIGVYGRGNTNGAQRSGGVMGDGGVTNTADTGSAIGVRGYADDTHAGGMNIGLYGSASNSGVNNYALYMNAGDVYSGAALTWTMNGNITFSGAYSVTIPTASTTTLTVKDVRDTVYPIGTGSNVSQGTITPDAANGNVQTVTLTGSITFNAFANPVSGQSITMIITQPSSGGPYTLTSSMKFANGAKTLSTAANAIDMLTISYVGSTYYASLITGFA